jgi:hypothetical protein
MYLISLSLIARQMTLKKVRVQETQDVGQLPVSCKMVDLPYFTYTLKESSGFPYSSNVCIPSLVILLRCSALD